MKDNNQNSAAHRLVGLPQLNGIVSEVGPDFKFDEFRFSDSRVPVVPLRELVPFPCLVVPLPVGRPASLQILEHAMHNKEAVLFVCQKDASVEMPKPDDIYRVGVLGVVARVVQLPDGTHSALVILAERARIKRLTRRTDSMTASIECEPVIRPENDSDATALEEAVMESYKRLIDLMPEESTREISFTLAQMTGMLPAIFYISMFVPMTISERQSLLESKDFPELDRNLLRFMDRAYNMTRLKVNIEQQTRCDMDQQQREMFLQQQLRTIRAELGDNPEESDSDQLKIRADAKEWDDKARAHFDKELAKLERYPLQSPDYAIQYNYLDTLLALPWNHCSDDNFELQEVERILNRDHFGMEKIKDRIIEHMAVLKLRQDMKAPILCLYGPPGVGKTSLGRSIAEALGREYARVSLGGVHDEAEIRGHRRTYIGAMPGRIISALAKCGSANPVFVLDEIDKLGADMKGDPSTALLEVLDPEQNVKFHDNYLGTDYDLSKIMFIATANTLSTLSAPLLDRMELIEIGGYIAEEKVEIALRHLWPRVLEDHGLARDEIRITPAAVRVVIDLYTRESGVRHLAKQLAKIVRKLARLKASDTPLPSYIDTDEAREYLGMQEVFPEVYETNQYAGVVTGLAWTSAGGEILFIESSLSEGKDAKLTLTGNLGDVMKESAIIALKYLKAHSAALGLSQEQFANNDVHIHVPAGAVPKDGPSAGITIATSLASALTGRRVRDKIAMTGEMTLRGKVLPVGGIREKVLAAKRAGIKEIILSSQNRRDVEEIPSHYLDGIAFRYVDRLEEVLEYALLEEKAPY